MRQFKIRTQEGESTQLGKIKLYNINNLKQYNPITKTESADTSETFGQLYNGYSSPISIYANESSRVYFIGMPASISTADEIVIDANNCLLISGHTSKIDINIVNKGHLNNFSYYIGSTKNTTDDVIAHFST